MPIRPVKAASVADSSIPTGRKRSGDYEVGKGKPPKHTQFKPGMSGNPKGRPKGAKALSTVIREQLLERVAVRTPKGERRIPKVQALVMKQVELASKGNVRALEKLLQLYAIAVPEQPAVASDTNVADYTDTDLAILAALLEQPRKLSEDEEG